MDPRLQELLAQNPGLILQALQSMPASSETGEAPGPVEGYAMYDPAKTAYGQSFQRYDPQGVFVGEGQFKKPGNILDLTGQFAKDMAPLALAALGANGIGAALGQSSIFGAGGLLGGGSTGSLTSGVTPGSVAAFEAGLPAAGAGSAAAGGIGSLTAGMTPATVAAMEAGLPSAGAGLGALGSLSGKAIGGLLGAAAGAANSGDKQQTTQQRLDPRMEALLYGADGKSGYLGAATDWFNQNKGGNPLMLQGAQMMADYYKSPQYTEGYNTLRNTGLGLLGMGMAGNPFTQPGGMPSSLGGGLPAMNMASMGGGMPQMPQAKLDAPPQAFDGGGGMMDMRYRGGPQMTPEQRRQREQDMQNMQLMAMRGFGG